jgi:hypothetical protein
MRFKTFNVCSSSFKSDTQWADSAPWHVVRAPASGALADTPPSVTVGKTMASSRAEWLTSVGSAPCFYRAPPKTKKHEPRAAAHGQPDLRIASNLLTGASTLPDHRCPTTLERRRRCPVERHRRT